MNHILEFLFRCFYSIIVSDTIEKKQENAVTLVGLVFSFPAMGIYTLLNHFWKYINPTWLYILGFFFVAGITYYLTTRYFTPSRIKSIKENVRKDFPYKLVAALILIAAIASLMGAFHWISLYPRGFGIYAY